MTFRPEALLELVVFKDDQVIIDVKVSSGEETVWLTQAQMARLFDNTPQNITMHIRNIYQEGELDPDSTCKDFLQVRNEGGRSISRKSRHYNLDMIISVGYRVKSNRGIVFRKWANRILKEYLLHGVVLDRSRLEAEKLQQITQILKRSVRNLESRQILDVIETYSRALTLLDKNQALFKHQTEKVIADDTLAVLTIMIAATNSMTLGRYLFTLALICVWFNPLAFSLSISRITVVVSLRILFPPLQWSDDHCKGRRSLTVNMSPERCGSSSTLRRGRILGPEEVHEHEASGELRGGFRVADRLTTASQVGSKCAKNS